jgi:hypothetical protein
VTPFIDEFRRLCITIDTGEVTTETFIFPKKIAKKHRSAKVERELELSVATPN